MSKRVKPKHIFLENIYIRFGTKLYRQIVIIPMGTNFVPLITDLFFFAPEGTSGGILNCTVRPSVRPLQIVCQQELKSR